MNILERFTRGIGRQGEAGIPKQENLSAEKQDRPILLTETEARFLDADTNKNYRAAQARNAEKIKAIKEDPNLTLPEKLRLIEIIEYPMGVPGEKPRTDEETNHNRTVTIITYLGECGKCVQNFIKEDSAKTI